MPDMAPKPNRFSAHVLTGTAIATIILLSAAASPVRSADDGLAARVDQLEQQLVELQVTIGTFESLARGRPAGGGSYKSAASSAGAADTAQMEIQIRALSGQVAALTREVRSLKDTRMSNAGTITNNSFAQPLDVAPDTSQQTSNGFGSVTVTNEQSRAAGDSAVTPDPIGSILSGSDGGLPPDGGTRVATSDATPRAAYDRAYGYLLEQDYGAAEVAFGEFISRHPDDPLAGNAQYWLGETHYVRGNYRASANAFLKGYKTYGKSEKAPDSLLKLAMSLSRLGQKPSACATFNELRKRYPDAPAHITRRSSAERQRAGC